MRNRDHFDAEDVVAESTDIMHQFISQINKTRTNTVFVKASH